MFTTVSTPGVRFAPLESSTSIGSVTPLKGKLFAVLSSGTESPMIIFPVALVESVTLARADSGGSGTY